MRKIILIVVIALAIGLFQLPDPSKTKVAPMPIVMENAVVVDTSSSDLLRADGCHTWFVLNGGRDMVDAVYECELEEVVSYPGPSVPTATTGTPDITTITTPTPQDTPTPEATPTDPCAGLTHELYGNWISNGDGTDYRYVQVVSADESVTCSQRIETRGTPYTSTPDPTNTPDPTQPAPTEKVNCNKGEGNGGEGCDPGKNPDLGNNDEDETVPSEKTPNAPKPENTPKPDNKKNKS